MRRHTDVYVIRVGAKGYWTDERDREFTPVARSGKLLTSKSAEAAARYLRLKFRTDAVTLVRLLGC